MAEEKLISELTSEQYNIFLTPEQQKFVEENNKFKNFHPTVIQLKDCHIYKNYRWGIARSSQKYIEDVPKIILTEYQSVSSPLLEDIFYSIRVAGETFKSIMPKVDPYLTMYKGVFTGNTFELPFFETYNHAMNNIWGDPDKNPSTEFRTWFAKGLGSLQYGSIESRKVWHGLSEAGYQFSFNLYNTFSEEDILKNFLFIRTLINNNLGDRTSFATLLPPCFYKLEIPGVRYAPIAVIAGLDIQNIGQLNRRKFDVSMGGRDYIPNNIDMIIPDAWSISISILELQKESRDIYNSTFSTSKVNVIESLSGNSDQYLNYSNIEGGGFI